jgi:hypothetical protein
MNIVVLSQCAYAVPKLGSFAEIIESEKSQLELDFHSWKQSNIMFSSFNTEGAGPRRVKIGPIKWAKLN